MGHFLEPINYHHDRVFAYLGPWRAYDEVQANTLPRGLRNGQWRVEILRQYMTFG